MFEFLFKYPRSLYQDSDFLLANPWPLWLFALLGLAGLAVIAFTLAWRRKTLSSPKLAAVGLLQAGMLALALFILWQPALVTERLVQGENAVALLLDTSGSMAMVDGETSRMSQAQALLAPERLRGLAEQYNLLPYAFADGAIPLDSFEPAGLPTPGEATRLGESLLQALRQSSGASLGAVIVLSDGADNDGGVSQAELAEISAFGVPVHTVGIGRQSIPEDLELQDVVLPAKALPGTSLNARLNIRHDQGGSVQVKVYDGERLINTVDVPLDESRDSTMAYVTLDVQDPGQMDLRFTLDPFPGERHLANNSRSHVVDVPESRYRILYVEGEPRWEYKFMQRALEDDPSVQLSTLLRVTPNKYYRQGIDNPDQLAEGFPTDSRDLYVFDALILGSVEAAEFSEAQQDMIRDFVSERGGSLLMLAGLSGLGQGGWGDSRIGAVLPARLSSDDPALQRNKARVSLTELGRASPLLRLADDDEENLRLWGELPEIADHQGMGALRPAATALLSVNAGGQDRPLLVTQPYGRGQSYILATGGTWRWQMSLPVEDLRHETFWRQLARGLVANSPLPFELSATESGGEIIVHAEIRDPEAEENQGLAITSLVTSSGNDALSLELQAVPGQAGVYEGSFRPSGAGLYTVEAISRVGDDPVDAASTAIRVGQGEEAFGLRQNRALLERLADSTGGRYWTAAQWDQIPEAISYSTAGITEQDVRYLWDAPILFLALALLKALEWLLRRRWRTI